MATIEQRKNSNGSISYRAKVRSVGSLRNTPASKEKKMH